MSQRNDREISRLSGDFQLRYEPNFAWKSACSAFLALPGLRGFWPMSSFDEAGNARDLSGQGRTLTYNGNPTYNYDSLAPYIEFDGVGDSLSRSDEAGLDITGTEAYVAGAVRGFTTGGWFWLNSFTPLVNAFIAKFTALGNLSYMLFELAGIYRFGISSDGTAQTTVDVASPTLGAWHFVVGRFIPSTELAIFDNGVKVTNVAAIPASIFSGNSAFCIGLDLADSSYLDGRASLCFLCATALSDAIVLSLFHQTRAMFGV